MALKRGAFKAVLVGLVGLLSSVTGAVGAEEPVTLVTVESRHVQEALPLTGTLTANQAALLSSPVAGLVTRLNVDLGDRVSAGDPLLILDGELNRLALRGARAAEDEARARLEDTRRRFQEASTLAARKSIAATEVRGLEADVAIAEAALAAARAEQQRQRALLDRHTVKAPFDGVISEKLTEVGEWVTPGTAVFGLVNSEDLRADFAVPQEYFPRLSKESELRLWLGGEDQQGQATPAAITAIVPVNDPSARTFLVRATLTGDGHAAATPGMSVRATLLLRDDQAQLTVPRDALVRYPDGRVSVWLAEENDDGLVAREQRIRVRDGLGDTVIVNEGLSAGDRVVVRGNESLTDGRELRVAQ